MVVWADVAIPHRVQARTLSAAGVLGPIRTLSRAGHDARLPEIAVSTNGRAVVVWEERFNGATRQVQARTLSAAGVLGPIQTLSQAGHDAYLPEVAVDADGDAVVVWKRWGSDRRVQARTLSATGVLGPIQTLSPPASLGPESTDNGPKVAVDRLGHAVVVWRNDDNFRVQARSRSRAGVLGPIQTLSAPVLHDTFYQKVAIDRRGNAVVTWVADTQEGQQIQARTLSAAGRLGRLLNLRLPTGHLAFDVRVAVSAQGRAAITYPDVELAGGHRVRGVVMP